MHPIYIAESTHHFNLYNFKKVLNNYSVQDTPRNIRSKRWLRKLQKMLLFLIITFIFLNRRKQGYWGVYNLKSKHG